MKSKTLHLLILIFSAVYTISCHDDDPAPLRFYDNYYEVPMGGKRHLGIESGNGNYSVEIADNSGAKPIGFHLINLCFLPHKPMLFTP